MATKAKNTAAKNAPVAPKNAEVTSTVAPATTTGTVAEVPNTAAPALSGIAAQLEAAKQAAVADIQSRLTKIAQMNADHEGKMGDMQKAHDSAISVERAAIDQLYPELKKMGVTIPELETTKKRGRHAGSTNAPKGEDSTSEGDQSRGGGRQRNAEGQTTTEAVLKLINRKHSKAAPVSDIMDLLKKPDGFNHQNPNSVTAYLKRSCKIVQTESRGGDFRFPTQAEWKKFKESGDLPENGAPTNGSAPVSLDTLLA
jgi:hypothetical protein